MMMMMIIIIIIIITTTNKNKFKNKLSFTSVRIIISYHAYLSPSVEISEGKVYFHAVMPSRERHCIL